MIHYYYLLYSVTLTKVHYKETIPERQLIYCGSFTLFR